MRPKRIKAKQWLEIKAKGSAADKDAAIELLIKAGSPGVIEESQPVSDDFILSHSTWTEPYAPERRARRGETASVTAYLPADISGVLSFLRINLERLGWTFSCSVYKDSDWSKKWKRFIKPVRVSYRKKAVIVRPCWKKATKMPGDVVVRIDPGMAFGTGSHETTKTCLKALLHILRGKGLKPSNLKILDVGTGSGVLAIAARKLGAGKAVAIDVDPVAVSVARANAKINRCKITLATTLVEGIKGSFDIVVANIISSELKRLSNALAYRLKSGGVLILSGILAHEKNEVADIYASIGLKPVREYLSGEWATLVFLKASL